MNIIDKSHSTITKRIDDSFYQHSKSSAGGGNWHYTSDGKLHGIVEPEGVINGFQVCIKEYKFLWFTWHSKHKLIIFPGYFIKGSKRVISKKPIYKSIWNPGKNTWYHIYLYYHDEVIDVVFHDKVGDYENYKRVFSVCTNEKKHIRPFVQHINEFIFTPPVHENCRCSVLGI